MDHAGGMATNRPPKLTIRLATMETELLELPPLENSEDQLLGELPRLKHRELRRDDFWALIPAFETVSAVEFHTHTFQARNTVTNVRQLRDTLRHRVPALF